MRKLVSMMLALLLVLTMVPAMAETGTGDGKGMGDITVEITLDDGVVTSVNITGEDETPAIGGAAIDSFEESIIGVDSADDVEVISGATITSEAVIEALGEAIAEALGEDEEAAALAFTAGTYTASAKGYNGMVEVEVTFSDNALTDVKVTASGETEHVGDVAYDIMIPDMIAANGSGVDAVSGATFTSAALRAAVNDAAEQAGCTDMGAFKSATVEHTAGEPIEDTWDVVVVGAGGAGMMAAAQAAQDGNTVMVLEKNAEMGGNTLVSGGAFQSVMPYLVWDKNEPDATTGVNPLDGQTYDKVMNDAGRIDTLKTILTWSEEPFDGTLDEDHPFVAGDIALNAVRGVHAEYLPTLQALKAEIEEYLAWAQPQLDAGVNETKITLFSTINLHIFQTYYGGLRPSADGSEWVYGRFDLVSQVINGGQEIKPWLVAQGSEFDYAKQSTLIGCLWQRENAPIGGKAGGVEGTSKWGAYFIVPYNTIMTANDHNGLMVRTTATELITDETGRVTGVKAVQYDGTEVTAHATKGVILATGGYAANIDRVKATNKYWNEEFIADNIGTTNRNSLQGDGMNMAEAVGAATEGSGWTQMMPLGWVDNGNLAGGAGENVIYVNAATGKRYVDESAERDVLSEGGFENGMSYEQADTLGLKNVPGIYVEISNPGVSVSGPVDLDSDLPDIAGRSYYMTVEDAAAAIGCDAETLRQTIVDYDNYVMGVNDTLEVPKLSYRGTVGNVEVDEAGNYLTDTYALDLIHVRYLAPSTHHTMGGVSVDTDRRVLDTEGNAIPGLYAAGEVTGGIHGGNRLGGNAVTEIIVSGRTAAKTVTADN